MSKGTLYHTAKYAIELASMIKPGDDLEGWVQSKLNKAADYLQGAYNYEEYQKLNPYREELDSNTLSKHAQVVQKHIDEILARETALDDIDTKPGMMRILNKKVNEVEKELAKENRKAQENMQYEDMLMNKLDSAMQEYDSPEKKAQRDALMKQYLAKGGKVEKVPAGVKAYKGKELKPAYKKDNGTPITSPGSDESVEEGAPFDGKGILQRAVFNKWISAEEWFHLKDEWQDAARELEQRYSDWPDGEGFGSSDHNFAIRDLMTAVGYEFDDQDTSGRFVVIKQPEEIEKAGIKNARMKGEPVATEGGMPASIIKHKQKLAHMSDEELANRFKDFDEQRLRQMAWRHGYGKMSSHYWDRVQAGKQETTESVDHLGLPLKKEDSAVKEDAPFGTGMDLVRMAVMRKFISAEEYVNFAKELKAAGEEVANGPHYADWPDGEGFGSSDGNFAIRDLMSTAGYEFDDNDTSGRFVVTKMPEKLAKMGITNARMRQPELPLKKEQDSDGMQPADLKRLGQSVPKIYVHKNGKTILIPKSKHNEFLAKGWKKSALRAE